MQFDCHTHPHCAVLTIQDNRFEASKTRPLKEKAQGLIDQGYCHLILNMRQVQYLDSFGLATIISLLKQCRDRNGTLTLCHLNDMGQRLIVVTRLDKVLTVWETETEAVDYLRALNPIPVS